MKINNDERPDLVDRYRLADIPQILFFDGNGVLVDRLKDLSDLGSAKSLETAMDRAIEHSAEVAYRESALKIATSQEPENALAWKALGDFYDQHLTYPPAIDAYLTARDLLGGKDSGGLAEYMTFEILFMELMLRNYDAAIEESGWYIQRFPSSSRLDQAYLYRGYAFFYKKAYAEAKKVLEQQTRLFPDSPYSPNAQEILSYIERAAR